MADLMNARRQIVEAWIACTGAPYRWGGKDAIRGLDCSGLIEVGFRAANVWPLGDEATADTIYRLCPKVEWSERLPGDCICYGEQGKAHHIVGIVSLPDRTYEGQIIGANHGGPPNPGEAWAAYEKRMDAKGAKVVIASDSYWLTRRLGVVRAPRLAIGVNA